MSESLDLGLGHTLRFIAFAPDRSIAHNAETFRDLPDDPRAGAIVTHPNSHGGTCESFIGLNSGINTAAATWTVECWDPLTLSPSLVCSNCGDHGFVRGGKWVPA